MKTFKTIGMAVLAAFTLSPLFQVAGCSSVQNAVDCNGICNAYKTCFDATYDTGACETRCQDNANSEPDYMDKATNCHDCLGDKSCASATFQCGVDCQGIVP